ncbi:hypothetical protein Cfor_04635, partial [Coptotermes formosanus]
MTRSGQPPPPAPPLRHSASFSCLSRGTARERPHRARTATLPTACADTDYGFVVRPRGSRGPAASVAMRLSVKYGNTSVMVLEEEGDNEDVMVGRSRTGGTKKENQTSLRGVLMKKSVSLLSPQAWWPPRSRRTRATKDEMENSVIETPQCDAGPQRRWRIPPPPPPLRLLGYRDCGCRQCRRDRQLLAPAASEDRLHRFDMVLTDFIHILVCRYGAC